MLAVRRCALRATAEVKYVGRQEADCDSKYVPVFPSRGHRQTTGGIGHNTQCTQQKAVVLSRERARACSRACACTRVAARVRAVEHPCIEQVVALET